MYWYFLGTEGGKKETRRSIEDEGGLKNVKPKTGMESQYLTTGLLLILWKNHQKMAGYG
jgi:hypothetical protein